VTPASAGKLGDAARRAFELRHTPGLATEPLLELYERMAG